MILRPHSIAAEVFGREAVRRALNAWFDESRGPVQLVGALYVFELYHRDVGAALREARLDAVTAPRAASPAPIPQC